MSYLRCGADNSPGRRCCRERGTPLAVPCGSCGLEAIHRYEGTVNQVVGDLRRRSEGRRGAQEHLTTPISMYHERDTRLWLVQAETTLK